MSELVEHMKKIAMSATDAASPVNILFGTVIGSNPLQINVEQRMVLGESQLVICQRLTDYEVSVAINWITNSAGDPAHTHFVSGTKTMTIKNALRTGDRVVLIRMQGGQKFFVMDRVV